MRTVSQIVEALKDLKSIHTDSEIANLLGVKPKTLAAAKVRDNYPFRELITFCMKNNVSLNWLLSGEGEPNIIKGALEPSLVLLATEATENRLDKIRLKLEPGKKGHFIVALTERCQKDSSIRNAKGEKKKRLVEEVATQYLKILK